MTPLLALTCVTIAPPPNVVLLMADDLGWGDVGYHGSPHARTPHLDAMAAAGVRSERFYAAAPVCSPTRGSVLTGRHPHRLGIPYANSGHLAAGEVTLAERLHDAGYATGFFGKWHLGTLTAEVRDANRGRPGDAAHLAPPWDHGFDAVFATESKVPTFDPLLRPRGVKRGTWWDPVGGPADAVPYGTAYWTAPGETVSPLPGDDSRLMTDRAAEFITDSVRGGRPFLAVVWFHAPHLPVVAPAESTAPFADLPPHERHYFGSVAALDEQVGRLRAVLRELGVARDTLVWFCSDNGPEGNARAPGSAGPFRGRKRSLYEGGVRVPGLLEWPAGLPGGTATDLPSVTSDILPTVLAAAGLEPVTDRELDGIDLLAPLRAGSTERSRPIGFVSRDRAAWSDDRFKLIRPAADVPWELYDLVADPGETRDLAGDRPDRVRRMAAKYAAWERGLSP